MKYNDVKNYTWYKITSMEPYNKTSERYIYKTDIEIGNRDLILGFSNKNGYIPYIMTLSKGYWTRYDRVDVVEEFPKDLNLQEAKHTFIYKLFEVGIE